MRRRTEWRVDVDRCGSWGQSADLLISNTETEENEIHRHSTHRKNKLQTSNYIMNKENTLTLLSARCSEVSKHSCDRSENQNLPRLSLNTLWLLASWTGNTAITSEMIKNLFNSVKKLNIFPSRCWGESFRIQEIPSEPVWVFFFQTPQFWFVSRKSELKHFSTTSYFGPST